MSVIDLDLTLTRHGDGYAAAIQLSPPATQLAPPTPWVLDPSALYAHEPDPISYGGALTAQLFASPALRTAWHEASAFAHGRGSALRLRLSLPGDAPELHALRWEALHDPARDRPLAMSDRIWLVRLPTTSSLAALPMPPRAGLRATVAVSSPRDLGNFGLGVVDIEGEVARARHAFGSACTAIVGDHYDSLHPRANLQSILAALHDSPHVLYLVCHSRLDSGESLLYLEGEAGETAVVRGGALVEAIEGLATPPLLAVMIACRSAGAGYGDALNALGPQLARAGVPAVIGFQGDVQQRTVRQCMRALWDELSRNGRIDRAMAVARRTIGDGMWWQPVLWLRARDGRLWQDEQPAPATPASSASTTSEPITLSPQLRALHADLWFEACKTPPDWAQVEQMALALLEAIPSDKQGRQLLGEAGRQLALQTRYATLRQRRAASVGWEDIAAALADLERDWPGFPDPDALREWAAEQRRTARLRPAIAQLREHRSAHAALDMIERFLEDHPDDSDAVSLMVSIIEMAEAPFEQRLRAARMAGRRGDPRCPIDIAQWRESVLSRSYTFGCPNGYWCYVASGTYRVGGPDDEGGASLALPAFWVARYPVTVAQYGQFIADGGYHEERWWTPEGWRARQAGQAPSQPWGWGDPRFSQPNQPVIGVSWDEATAFCAWLSLPLRTALASYQICLPDEGMWEVAARYAQGHPPRSYPWGEEPPSIERAIHTTQPPQLRGDAPAPVGCCVAGAAACGALDMAGNIWELMASSWESFPYGTMPPGPNEHIAWRGGTWSSSARAMRCVERDRTRREGHNYAQGGFRVIIAPRR